MDETLLVPDAPIDLNDVTREQLEDRCGLSPEVSEAIVAFGAAHGPWTSIEQLLEIPGIDTSLLETLRERLYVAPSGESAPPPQEESAHAAEETRDRHERLLEPEAERDISDAVVSPTPVETDDPAAFGTEDAVMKSEGDDILPAEVVVPEPESLSDVPESEPVEDLRSASEPMEDRAIEDASLAPQEAASVPVPENGMGQPPVAADSREEDRVRALVVGESTSELSPDEKAREEAVLETATFSEPVETEAEPGRLEDGVDEATSDVVGSVEPARVDDLAAEPPSTVETTATAAVATSSFPDPARRRSPWRDIGMVALGGLVGAALTLLILGGVSGTLSYAPRRLVDALSQNMSTMQDNQQATWDQLQSLQSRADVLEERLGALEDLEGRIVELEAGSAAIETQLQGLTGNLDQLDADLTALESRHAALIKGLDTRVGNQERDLDALGGTVGALRDTVQEMQSTVTRFESFFDALRDLLIDMQGDAAIESGA
ncbi:MAG: helix-hairpin-helix domain-containing protein [Anaerolineae bacterium]